jgi:hypothetical protein
MDTSTRWNLKISRQADIAVRSFLARRGMKKGDLSKFVEEAVRWRVLDQTVSEARRTFADLAPDDLEQLLAEAVTQTRHARRRGR